MVKTAPVRRLNHVFGGCMLMTPQVMPLIIGHRGASHDAPENTMESFRLALEQGADGIEADFRLTADGSIVCMHDKTTGRTARVDLEIAATTVKELRALDAGAWKGDGWSGVMIPTLDEVLAGLPHDSWFFIEIKSGMEIIPCLESVLRSSGRSPERIRLLSFSAPLIAALKLQLPDWHSSWLCDYRHSVASNMWRPSRAELLETLLATGADGLASADRPLLDQELADALKRLGKEIHVWTVDRLPAARRLFTLGVDSIMTNRPGFLRQRLLGHETP